MSIAKKYLFLTALVGALLILTLAGLLAVSHQHNQLLQGQLQALESRLAVQEQARAQAVAMAGPGAASSPVDRQIKDLSTRFVGDSRNLAEKLRDFTAGHSSAQDLAIACKVVADLAENPDALDNAQLAWLYPTQSDPNLKRVIAQVLSLRGDNHLLDAYSAGLGVGLADISAPERRQRLGELAKTRYAGAARWILPQLAAEDTAVLLDALLALRNTGNESHLPALASLQTHGDESVRWLAQDAANNLQYLSKKARTRITSADIVAELPPIAAQ